MGDRPGYGATARLTARQGRHYGPSAMLSRNETCRGSSLARHMDVAPCAMALPNSMAQAIEFVRNSKTVLLLPIKAKDGLDQRFLRAGIVDETLNRARMSRR